MSDLSKISVLIVDDEEAITNVIDLSVKKIGLSSQVCTSPREAIDILKKSKIDILITDLRMPEIDGHSLTQEALKTNKKIKIVVITGDGRKEDAVKALQNGVFDF